MRSSARRLLALQDERAQFVVLHAEDQRGAFERPQGLLRGFGLLDQRVIAGSAVVVTAHRQQVHLHEVIVHAV